MIFSIEGTFFLRRPPRRLQRPDTSRHQRVAVLSLRPVRYNPVRRELRITGKLRVTVRFISSRAPKPARVPAPRADRGFRTCLQVLPPQLRGRKILADGPLPFPIGSGEGR